MTGPSNPRMVEAFAHPAGAAAAQVPGGATG